MEEAEKLAISAPVRAARAFYTFLLMDNWGDTPIVDYTCLEKIVLTRLIVHHVPK